ncbi:MAG: DivIVA domain-containing protein [Acidimicrobiales bacterium]|nr:DivIVA domain-containing protein [Acidimicrobiales bacterium]
MTAELTGREIVARTFSTARRGYDTVEVDAFLEKVGRQIDMLLGDIDRLNRELDEAHALVAKAAKTPPTEAAPAAPVAAAPVAPAEDSSRATGEAADIVLQMAHKTAADAIAQAKERAAAITAEAKSSVSEAVTTAEARAAEVVQSAEANAAETLQAAETTANETVAAAEFKAAEMQRESDRKAFEAASRSQGELRSIQAEIEKQRNGLILLDEQLVMKRENLRTLAAEITKVADASEAAPTDAAAGAVIDLAAAEAQAAGESSSSPADAETAAAE